MTLRHKARELALQLLYQWEVRGVAPENVEEVFWPTAKAAADTREFAHRLFTGAAAACSQLDALIEKHATNWRLDRMSAVDRNILRLAAFELKFATAPANVVLDEAVELAKTFSDEAAAGFVNGVLDAILKSEKSETRNSALETRKSNGGKTAKRPKRREGKQES